MGEIVGDIKKLRETLAKRKAEAEKKHKLLETLTEEVEELDEETKELEQEIGQLAA